MGLSTKTYNRVVHLVVAVCDLYNCAVVVHHIVAACGGCTLVVHYIVAVCGVYTRCTPHCCKYVVCTPN